MEETRHTHVIPFALRLATGLFPASFPSLAFGLGFSVLILAYGGAGWRRSERDGNRRRP